MLIQATNLGPLNAGKFQILKQINSVEATGERGRPIKSPVKGLFAAAEGPILGRRGKKNGGPWTRPVITRQAKKEEKQ